MKNCYEEVLEEVTKLKRENEKLKYMLKDMYRIRGCFEIEGAGITAAYQDIAGILLGAVYNGYTVELTPLHNNTKIRIVIKESEDNKNE